MHSANPSSPLRCALWICLCASAALLGAGCGANDTKTPAIADHYSLPPEFHIENEFFIAVHPDPKTPEVTDPMAFVRQHIQWLYEQTKDTGTSNLADSSSIVGCGGFTVRERYEYTDSYLFCVRLPNPEFAIQSLLRNPQIRYIEDHGRVVADGVQVCPPSWGLDVIDQEINHQLNHVYAYQRTGAEVHVYVIDSGVNNDNPPFTINDNLKVDPMDATKWASADADTMGHGTAVAGIVAGVQTGVAKKAVLHGRQIPFTVDAMKDPREKVYATKNDVAKMIFAMAKSECTMTGPRLGPSIVLLPFTEESNTDPPAAGTVAEAVTKLMNCGFVVVASAGNKTDEAKKYAPAGVKGVIAVGAHNFEGRLSSFSNYGSGVSIVAPGEDVKSVRYDAIKKQWVFVDFAGTSAAAAYAAGVAAQILEENRDITTMGAGASMQMAKLLQLYGQPGLSGDLRGTPDRILHSPYGRGETADDQERDSGVGSMHGADGCWDALRIADMCSAEKSCDQVISCPGTSPTPWCLGSWSLGSNIYRGISCKEGQCASCGLKHEPCCGSGETALCADSLICMSKLCISCGGEGDPCCKDRKCSANLSCSESGTCECGDLDQSCCKNDKCDGNGFLVCANKPASGDKTCQECGKKDGDLCCAGSVCPGRSDLVCDGGNRCRTCGSIPGDPCCNGNTCPGDPDLVCGSSNSCVACGGKNQPCCKGVRKCNGGLACGDGLTCTDCGGINQKCCEDSISCRGDLECKTGTCQGGGACGVRCTNGALIGLAIKESGNACYIEGIDRCGKDCLSTLARVRYRGVPWYENDKNCGDTNQACCMNEEDKGVCDKRTGLTCKGPTGLACSTGNSYTCQ